MKRRGLRKIETVQRNPVRLVVVEEGADTFHLRSSGDDDEETMVIGQGHENTPLDLVFRVIHKLSLLERAGRRVVHAVIRVGPRLDGHSMAARNLLARALLTHSAVGGSTELVLAAGPIVDGELRLELLALVEQLLAESVVGQSTIRIHFEDDPGAVPAESGTFPCAPPASAGDAPAGDERASRPVLKAGALGRPLSSLRKRA